MTQSDLDSCVLRLDSYGIVIPNWTDYTFTDSYSSASGGFSFRIGDPHLPHVLPDGISNISEIREGLKVGLNVNGTTILTGYIDDVHYEATRSGGTLMTLSGRSTIADAIDAIMDPKIKFEPTQSLASIIQASMEPFGFYNEPIVDASANLDTITGNKFGFKVYGPSKARHSGKKRRKKRTHSVSKAGQQLASSLGHQVKPRDHEGVYEFCERICKRQGLHMRVSGDGLDLLVGKPNFEQDARYSLIRRRGQVNGAQNNILSGSVNRSRKDQASIIVAGGGGGGGDVDRATNKVVMTNWLVGIDKNGLLAPGIQQILDRYPKAYPIGLDDVLPEEPHIMFPYVINPYPRARPMFLWDSEARNMEQLINFTLRSMAEMQAKALSVSYEVEGHSQNGIIWAVDSIVHVTDEVGQIDEPMWIESVTFSKSRDGGTKTSLVLRRPYTVGF